MQDHPASSLGRFLCEQRKQRGMGQIEVGRAVGVSQAAVSQWETGRAIPSPDYFPKLADVLGVDLATLVELTPHGRLLAEGGR
jgi:transcriptional regulator with XRE-family HTH domain